MQRLRDWRADQPFVVYLELIYISIKSRTRNEQVQQGV